MLKLHIENVYNEVRSDIPYEEVMCNEISYCTKWVDPEVIKKKIIQESVEETFI